MQFGRSFFFAVLVASAIPALSADNESSLPQTGVPAQTQATLTRGPYARQFLAQAGLLWPQEETRVDFDNPSVGGATPFENDGCNPRGMHVDLGGPWLPATPLYDRFCNSTRTYANLGHLLAPGTTPSSGGLCYTMRTYKVKRTERLAGGESASRGYSTCESASTFHIRTLVAPAETAGAPKAPPQQK